MNWNNWLPLLIILSSLIPAFIIFFLAESSYRLRTVLNLFSAFLKVGMVLWLLWGVYHNFSYEMRIPFLPDLDLVLRADALSILFITLSTLLWLVTTIYAVGYLEGSPYQSRFFGFFSLCVTATIGIALAGNLITFLLFYEFLTLVTYPLVVHKGTDAARKAGNNYLAFTFFGGTLLLLGTVWLNQLTGNLEFSDQGFVSEMAVEYHPRLIIIYVMLIMGLGVKAALVPFHGWLPQAMVAPAPVSALLHAVAVVKAGAFGIVRVTYDVYGIEFSEQLGVTGPLAGLAAITIIYGSLRALFQDDLKRRLAFSTVSQVSYIALGVGIGGPLATIGGVVHLVHQGMMKITLFFCAGNFAETLGIHKISEMNGIGKRMPLTMAAFTMGAFGMIGAPPMAGFVSKWYLGLGALNAGSDWVIYILAFSSLLNAAYFLPILYAGWFKDPPASWPSERNYGRVETAWQLLLPPIATALMALAAGLLASEPYSPLEWAQLFAEREYKQ